MNTYTITHANGSIDIIKGWRLEHNAETGQILIHGKERLCSLNGLVAVVPATSFVKLLDEHKAIEEPNENSN